MIPCGLKEWSLKLVRRVGDREKMGWPMAFQHANDIMQVEAPSSTIVQNIFQVKKNLV
jgi:hypothetical protein